MKRLIFAALALLAGFFLVMPAAEAQQSRPGNVRGFVAVAFGNLGGTGVGLGANMNRDVAINQALNACWSTGVGNCQLSRVQRGGCIWGVTGRNSWGRAQVAHAPTAAGAIRTLQGIGAVYWQRPIGACAPRQQRRA